VGGEAGIKYNKGRCRGKGYGGGRSVAGGSILLGTGKRKAGGWPKLLERRIRKKRKQIEKIRARREEGGKEYAHAADGRKKETQVEAPKHLTTGVENTITQDSRSSPWAQLHQGPNQSLRNLEVRENSKTYSRLQGYSGMSQGGVGGGEGHPAMFGNSSRGKHTRRQTCRPKKKKAMNSRRVVLPVHL